jgi:hypothetical protein
MPEILPVIINTFIALLLIIHTDAFGNNANLKILARNFIFSSPSQGI